MNNATILNDPISDMLTRIRNAVAVQKNEVYVPHSNVKQSVAEILAKNNFIEEVSVEPAAVGKLMKIVIYQPAGSPKITEIARMSKPGRRYYTNADNIPTVKRGRGIVIVSTSKGMMTGEEAKKQRVGGEVICRVY